MSSISVNSKEFEREIKRFNRNLNTLRTRESDRAVQSVLNRGITIIRKQSAKASAEAIGITQKAVKSRFSKYRRAKPNNLSIRVGAKTKALNAISAGAKNTGTGLKLGPYEWDEAFVIQSPNGNRPIGVKRKTKKRYPLTAAQLGKPLIYREFKKALDASLKNFINGDYRVELYKEMSKRFDKLMK